ncbi:MAG: nucleotide exchange factor GrpE [Anaerolineales bacterium]|nr:nucleotide exchange factor GrpE [Anaerolineales bacterium]
MPEPPAAGDAESSADPEALRAELEQARAQADEYLDGWKRTQAELVNYRKRVERDAAEARISAAGQASARWFAVLDDFERALKERSTAQNLAQWADGVELIYRKGVAAIEAEGITPIEPAPGTVFDPNVHEALSREMCADRGDGEILEVVHRGYRMGERVLRPAQVRVACKPESNSQ